MSTSRGRESAYIAQSVDDYSQPSSSHESPSGKAQESLVDSKMFESLSSEDVSQSYEFIEVEITRITSLPNYDNLDDRRLIKKLESFLRSILEDMKTTKGVKGE
jgi:hypothetical protein